MPDVAFTWLPDEPPPGPAWANRLAVARGTLSQATRSTRTAVQQMACVQILYRNQLARLRRKAEPGAAAAMWPVVDSKRFPWLRNCPPYGVSCRSPKKLRICGLQQICPWCWGRRVVAPAYRAVARAVARHPGCRVVVLRWVTDRPVSDLAPDAAQRSAVNAMRAVIKYWRKAGALGGVATWTVSPGPLDSWRTAVRLMLVMPEKPTPAETDGELPKYARQWDRPDRRDVVRAASTFGRYPGGLLTKPPAAVAALLTSRPKGRHFTSFGVCNAGFGKPRKRGGKISDVKTINPGD